MISLTIPYPPQTNHLMTVVRGRKIKSRKYREWLDLVCPIIAHQMRDQKPIEGPFHISLEVDRPDRRRRDLDNTAKAQLDALVISGAIRDDSDSLSIIMKWAGPDPVKPASARIEIEAA